MDFFTNRNNLQLACKFSIKIPSEKNIYIICHGQLIDMDFFLYSYLSENLQVNTFRFDFSGNGHSQGDFSWASFEREANDLDDAIKFLTSQGYSVAGIIGHSKGGNTVVIYSAIHGEIKKIIALAPRFYMNVLPHYIQENYETLQQNGEILHSAFGKEFRITKEMVIERMNVDMKHYCERAQGNIYILHGEIDEIIPYSDSLAYAQELKENCKGHYTLNCRHFFNEALEQVIEIIHQIISNS